MKKVLKLSFSIFLAMTMSLSNVVSIFAQEEQSEQIVEIQDEIENEDIDVEENTYSEEMDVESQIEDSDTNTELTGDSTCIEYFLLEESNVSSTQNFVLSLLKDEGYTNFSIDVSDAYGNIFNVESNERVNNLIKFTESFSSGAYIVTKIHYQLNEQNYVISLSDIGIEAKFGVNQEVYSENELVDLEEISEGSSSQEGVVSIDSENVNSSSEIIEEELNVPQSYSISSYALDNESDEIILCLDPGHGGSDSGTYTYYSSQNGLYEKYYNLKIAQYCKQELEKYANVKVYLTRYDDTYLDLKERAQIASDYGASYLISFHLNGLNGTNRGAVIFYPNTNYRPDLSEDGKVVAQSVLNELTALGIQSMGIRTNTIDGHDEKYDYPDGSEGDYYGVIRHAKNLGITGLIIEHCFADNKADFDAFLSSESKLQNLGIADATGIAKALGLKIYDQDDFVIQNKNIINDGTYMISSNSSYVIGLNSNDVNLSENTNLDLQAWRVINHDNGYVSFMNVYNGKYLNCDGDSLTLSDDDLSMSSLWVVSKQNSNYYIHSGIDIKYVLSNENNQINPSLNKELDNQKWSFISFNQNIASVLYKTHLETVGWTSWKQNGEESGSLTYNQGIQALNLKLSENINGSILYQSLSNNSWGNWQSDGSLSGTTGKGINLEAIRIKLSGEASQKYDIYYRVYSTKYGWQGWAKNGQASGSNSMNSKIVSIQVKLLLKGINPPGSTENCFYEKQISYQTHVQTYGWQETKYDGETSGTTGQSKRLEGITIKLTGTQYSGDILYRTHVQTYGWQEWKSNGQVSGTTGESKRLEAIQIKLSGDISNYYDVYYRVHAQTFGWLGWAKNGEKAGTEGLSKRLEAIEIVLREKDDPITTSGKSYIGVDSIGTLSYSVNYSNTGWQDNKSNGETSGSTTNNIGINGIKINLDNSDVNSFKGNINYQIYNKDAGWSNVASNGDTLVFTDGNTINAIKISLTDELYTYCDIYYRTYITDIGWLGWAKNGQSAGSSKIGNGIEAIQIMINMKTTSAPGPNLNYYREYINSTMQSAYEINNSLGRDLRKAFDYAKNIEYSRYEPADVNSYGSENYAKYGFANQRGNCYVMAAVFTYLAQELGYDAHQVGGQQGSLNTPHSWVEIVVNGTIYVCDPDFEKELGRNGFMFTYGSSGTLKYHDYSRMN